jgi:hypothetical protein
MTFKQYSTCVTGLLTYVMVGNELEGKVIKINTVGAATSYSGVFPAYLALDTQTPGRLGGVRRLFAGCLSVRLRIRDKECRSALFSP